MCEMFLADIHDPIDGIGDAPSTYLPAWPDGLAIYREYNEVIRRCATSMTNVHIVRLHATFLGHGSHCRQFWRSTYCSHDPRYWYFDNIEDPNDRGHDAARRVFLNTIVENRSHVADWSAGDRFAWQQAVGCGAQFEKGAYRHLSDQEVASIR